MSIHRRIVLPALFPAVFAGLPTAQAQNAVQPGGNLGPPAAGAQPLWRGATNGVKPFAAGGGPVRDKNWFRIVSSNDYVPGEIYVRFEPETDNEYREAGHLTAGATQVLRSSQVVSGLVKVTVPVGSEIQAINAYLNDPRVQYAEPIYRTYPADAPNDPDYDEQWGFASMRAESTWDAWQGDRNFKVAVIDTGIQLDHPDLVANIWTNPGEVSGNGVDDDNNGYIDDVHGWDTGDNDGDPGNFSGNHGIHVAGTVAAAGNNGTGVTGVNWRASIVAITFNDCVEALEYALVVGCRVSNHSYKHCRCIDQNDPCTQDCNGTDTYSQAMYDMIARARDDYGHLVVAAAGNDGLDIDDASNIVYPAGYDLPNIISVANYQNEWDWSCLCYNDSLAGSSNYGDSNVDLAAPGTEIYSTIDNSGYGFKNGTSMASPHVAGAAALIWGAQPYLNWQAVRARILDGVSRDGDFADYVATGGKLNVDRAFATWLDFNSNADEFGSYRYPYDTLAEALGEVVPSGTVMIKSGSSGWTGTISTPCYLDAWGGTVAIGQ